VADHHGRIVKTTGDGILTEFASAVDAVRCAVEIQRAMAERNTAIPEDRRIEFRIGINVGDVLVDEGDIYGDGVNIAARLEVLASPGAICLFEDAYNQIKNKLTLNVSDIGEQHLKNIARQVRVYAVWLDGSLDPPRFGSDAPIFSFYRNAEPITQFAQFRGKRLSIGTPGTALRALIFQVLTATDAVDASTQLLDLDSAEAIDALIASEIDVAIFASQLDTSFLQRALGAPGLQLMNLRKLEAIAKTVPGLKHLVLSRGSLA
jgi:hypothetical protein